MTPRSDPSYEKGATRFVPGLVVVAQSLGGFTAPIVLDPGPGLAIPVALLHRRLRPLPLVTAGIIVFTAALEER